MISSAIGRPGCYSILWLLNFPTGDLPSGATLRYRNFARSLRALGHRVHFLVPDWSYDESALQALVDAGIADSAACLQGYRASGYKNALGRALIHPRLRNAVSRRAQRIQIQAIGDAVARCGADALIFSERTHLFAIPELSGRVAIVIDWGDSEVLYSWRKFRWAVTCGNFRTAASAVSDLATYLPREAYYPRLAHQNIVVSQADKAAFRVISGRDARFQLLFNGIDCPDYRTGQPPKLPDRIIFTGRMDFPPNYQSALWFLDSVFPLVLKTRPATRCVIAGTNPGPQLLARASCCVAVTGRVPDILAEIAQSQLYIAPLVSGSGFKNKVIEAMAAGTYVVGTTLAAEFLEGPLRQCMTVAGGPGEFAEAVITALDAPAALAPKVEEARRIVRQEFSWLQRTRELVCVLNEACDVRAGSGAPVLAAGASLCG